MSARPAASRPGVSGCRMSSFKPVRFSSFLVTTTLPMTRARCIAFLKLRFVKLDVVDDADDGGVDGTVFHAGGHPRGAAGHDEHGFADAGVHRVDGDEVAALSLAPRIH